MDNWLALLSSAWAVSPFHLDVSKWLSAGNEGSNRKSSSLKVLDFQHICRQTALRVHLRLRNETCHQSFSCWKHKGRRSLQCCWPCPSISLHATLIFQPVQWPSSKSHEAEDNNGCIPPPRYGKIVINLGKKNKMRKAFCHSILITLLLLSQSCARNIDLIGTAKQLPCK